MNKISLKRARELLSYDPDTGVMTWKQRPWLEGKATTFNLLWAGKPVGNIDPKTGYLRFEIGGQDTSVHRMAWFLTRGKRPHYIDHINGDRLDNRLANLRAVTPAESAKNRERGKRNRSGVIGVSWCKEKASWYASIWVGGKTLALGRYADLNEAAIARKAAERAYGFHPNHGRAKRRD